MKDDSRHLGEDFTGGKALEFDELSGGAMGRLRGSLVLQECNGRDFLHHSYPSTQCLSPFIRAPAPSASSLHRRSIPLRTPFSFLPYHSHDLVLPLALVFIPILYNPLPYLLQYIKTCLYLVEPQKRIQSH